MKKIFTLILALVTLTALQANADLWLIGAISPDGWNPSKGVQFTQVDDNNYTLELDVTKTGKQYYGLTSKLGSNSSDWDGIKAYRFGGKDLEVKLDTETTLVEGTDDSPFTNFATAGTYTFDFNISTKVVKVSLKSENPDQPTAFNGTIYIDKESIGNIWAWDTQGNYFDAWPGKPIAELSTTTVEDVEYYYFTYSHNSTDPGLIFNDGSAQTGDLTPEDGKLYKYTGGTNVTITDLGGTPGPGPEPTNEVIILGEICGNEWAPNNGYWMDTEDNITYTADVTIDSKVGYFSFTTKLAEDPEDWGAIAAYRFGAESKDLEVTEDMLGTQLNLIAGDNAFKMNKGSYHFELNMETKKLTITGDMIVPQPIVDEGNVYILGDVNGIGWFPNKGFKMDTEDNNTFTATVIVSDSNEGNGYFSFTKALGTDESDWDAIGPFRFGAVTDELNYEVTEDMLGTELQVNEPGKGYASFMVPGGVYNLTLNLQALTLVIEAGEMPNDVYVLGEVNGNGWAPNVGVKMNTTDNVNYTLDITTAGASEGFSYFSFTKQLGNDDTNWDAIGMYRFGAAADTDLEVTEEMLGTELTVTEPGKGYNAFKIAAGQFTLNLNMENHTLVIKANSSKYDVNGDGEEDVRDVTALINYLLGAPNPNKVNLDINGDGDEDVRDLTALINYLLN